MKIKCYAHDRRVMMLRDKDLPIEVIIHRNDGTHCDTKTLVQGDKFILYRDRDHMVYDDSILLNREN